MAYSDVQWGNIIQGSSNQRQGRIGISYELLDYSASVTVNIRVYFWSKFSVSDSSNNFYADWNANCSTNHGSVSVKTTSSSGGGWSTTNQILLASYSNNFNKSSSAYTGYFSAKLTGIDNLGSGNSMTASVSFTVAALPRYTVTFDLNGGTLVSGSTSQTVSYNGSATPPSVSRTGYTFAGWSGTYTGVTSSTKITATWTGNKYKLTFDPNGGTLPNPGDNLYNESHTGSNYVNVQYGVDSYCAMRSDIPTRQNYIFVGWFDVDNVQVYDVKGNCLNGSKYWSNSTWCYDGDVTVYAHWLLEGYTITFYDFDGTTVFAQQVVPPETTVTLLNQVPTHNGLSCSGWTIMSGAAIIQGEGTQTIYYFPGQNITLRSDISLYPIWDLWKYTLHFDANGGMGQVPKDESMDGYYTTYVFTEVSLSGASRKFIGWNTELDGTGTMYYPGDYFTDHQDGGTVTLFAIYQNTEVYFYKDGTIECIEFIEEENCTSPYITKEGNVVALKFIEHDGNIMFEHGTVYAKKFVEKELVLTPGASNLHVTDLLGNELQLVGSSLEDYKKEVTNGSRKENI